jgi:outer membrane protein insertion porin family
MLAAVAITAWATPDDPPPIVRVEVVTDGDLRPAAIQDLLGLTEGAPLDRRRLREGIRALYAGGGVDQLEVVAEEEGGGLAVTVTMSATPRLADLDVEGASLLLGARLREWTGLRRGAFITAGDVESAVARVRRRLDQMGWEEAHVEASLDYRREDNTVNVEIDVDLGVPLAIARVTVVGIQLPEGDRQQIATRWAEKRYTRELGDEIVRAVEARVRELGWWEAESIGTELSSSAGPVTLEVRIDPGSRYVFEIEGSENEAVVRGALPDPNQVDVHPAQTDVLAEQIREALQAGGRLLARVSVELDAAIDPRVVRVQAMPGPVVRVAEVRFDGATSIASGRLEEVVAVHPGPTTGWRGQHVTTVSLETDRLALVDIYRREGFAEARVDRPAIEPGSEPATVVIHFSVEEGRRWRLADVRFEGVPLELAGGLDLSSLGLDTAGPWDPRRVDEATRLLGVELANRGYPDAQVAAEVDTTTPGEARVVLRVDSGSFVHLGEVLVSGLTTTREGVVRRVLERSGVVTGAPYSLAAVLDAQRRLSALGLFRRVEVVPIPGQERLAVRGMVVRCEEGQQRSYLFGVGWDTTSGPRITLGWTHLNLLGGAHAFNVETRLSRDEKRLQLGLRERYLPWLDEPGYASIYRTEERFPSYSQLRRGLWFEVGDRLRRPFRPWLRYEYQIVNPKAPADILSDLEREQQQIQVASITPTLEYDLRDDPLSPHRGSFATFSVQWAFPAFNADARFLKTQLGLSVYHPFTGGTASAGLRLGAIRPIAATGTGPENLEIPIGARFFAGGPTTNRAFKRDLLGVPGQTINAAGDPIGGNAMALLNLEYQHSIRGGFLGVVFVDAGNVWEKPSMVRLSDVRWGGGLGVRLATPAGPVRLEYGWKLDRKPGESAGELFLAFGIPF